MSECFRWSGACCSSSTLKRLGSKIKGEHESAVRRRGDLESGRLLDSIASTKWHRADVETPADVIFTKKESDCAVCALWRCLEEAVGCCPARKDRRSRRTDRTQSRRELGEPGGELRMVPPDDPLADGGGALSFTRVTVFRFFVM